MVIAYSQLVVLQMNAARAQGAQQSEQGLDANVKKRRREVNLCAAFNACSTAMCDDARCALRTRLH